MLDKKEKILNFLLLCNFVKTSVDSIVDIARGPTYNKLKKIIWSQS